jgi:ABC-type nitrate/sulfonate/bicarbonate transport system substrate-binding protein
MVTTRRAVLGGLGASAAIGPGALAQTPTAVIADTATLGPPSNAPYLLAIIQDQELEKKFALEYKPTLYSETAPLYAEFAAGKIKSMLSGLYVAVNMRARGLPVQLMFTFTTTNHAIVSKHPAIREPIDLKGRTLAATTSSGHWGMVVLFLKNYGLDPRRDLEVVNVAPAAVQAQVLAGEVDAGVLRAPALSNVLVSGCHLVGNMNVTLRQMLGMTGDAPIWYLGMYAWQSWLEQDAARNRRLLEMFQAAAAFYYREPERADRAINALTKIPLETLKFSRDRGLTEFRIIPAIRQQANLRKIFEGFKEAGTLNDIPGDELYYPWPGLKTQG